MVAAQTTWMAVSSAGASGGSSRLVCAVSAAATASDAGSAAKPVAFSTEGTRSIIAVFATFADGDASQIAPPAWSNDLFDPDRTGSFSHYYDTMSFGKLRVRGEVASRRYRSLHSAEHYLSSDPTEEGRFGQFCRQILTRADEDIDFSRYDNDGPDETPNSGDDDGVVDIVFIVVPFMPEGFLLGRATGIASLGFDTDFITDDVGAAGNPIRVASDHGSIQQGNHFTEAVGILCHEYGHLLGLPDLFNTRYLQREESLGPEEDSAGIGAWGLMGWGASGWNGRGGPNSLSAWSRMELGWEEVKEVTSGNSEIILNPIGEGGKILRLPVTWAESFLVEYRTRDLYYDRDIHQEGLLIWHVARRSPTSAREVPVVVDLESADGRFSDAGFPRGREPDPVAGGDNLDFWAHDDVYAGNHAGNLGDAGDPYDGLRYTRFTPDTNPDSYSNDRLRSVRIDGIRIENGVARAQIQAAPLLIEIYDLHLADEDGDGLFVSEERVEVRFRLRNRGRLDAGNLRAVLATEDSLIRLDLEEASFRDLSMGQITLGGPLSGTYPAFRLRDPSQGAHQVAVDLEIHANGRLVEVARIDLSVASTRPFLREVRINDEEGNGDAAAQAGEIVQVELVLQVAHGELFPELIFRLVPLMPVVTPAAPIGLGFVRIEEDLLWSLHSAEFLLPGNLTPGTALPFEFSVTSRFGTFRDTVFIQVAQGIDSTPPRAPPPLVSRRQEGVELSLSPHLILEGSGVAGVKTVVYLEQDTSLVVRIPLEWMGNRWLGVWEGAGEGSYLLAAELEDLWGNVGRSPLRRLYLGPMEPLARTIEGFGNSFLSVAVSPDGRYAAAGSLDQTIWLWDLKRRELAPLLSGHQEGGRYHPGVIAVAFSPESRLLASGGGDGTVRLWDVARREQVSVLERDREVQSLAFLPSGQWLVTSSLIQALAIWDLEHQSIVDTIEVPRSLFQRMTVSPDGRWLATSGRDVLVVDLLTGAERTLAGPPGRMEDMAFNGDGTLLAGAGFMDSTLWVWETEGFSNVAVFKTGARNTSVIFGLREGELFSGDYQGVIRVWDLEYGVTDELRGHLGRITDLAMGPNEHLLVSTGEDGTMRTWDLRRATADEKALPEAFTLLQNYPNPFNSDTVIGFALPTNEDVELVIFNLAGQRVATLADGTRSAGTYTLRWAVIFFAWLCKRLGNLPSGHVHLSAVKRSRGRDVHSL